MGHLCTYSFNRFCISNSHSISLEFSSIPKKHLVYNLFLVVQTALLSTLVLSICLQVMYFQISDTVTHYDHLVADKILFTIRIFFFFIRGGLW